ncbi:UvrB/UvrC motif-containing protein, partial [Candidatus Parcubacteria bacterium]|nr:UvrB/UvrC motif-containing protein [Candidatus Parcubacteria bacterium]
MPFALIGPFLEGLALKQTLRLLRKVFPFRTCHNLPKKACLYKELGLCLAPCQLKVQSAKLKVNKTEYKKNVHSLRAVLEGKKTAVLKGLKKEMQMASKEQNFEKAKELRDKIFALEKVLANAKVLKKEKTLENENSENINAFKALQKILDLKEKVRRV